MQDTPSQICNALCPGQYASPQRASLRPGGSVTPAMRWVPFEKDPFSISRRPTSSSALLISLCLLETDATAESFLGSPPQQPRGKLQSRTRPPAKAHAGATLRSHCRCEVTSGLFMLPHLPALPSSGPSSPTGSTDMAYAMA